MKVYAFLFFNNFYKGNNILCFLFASPDNTALPNWGLLLKERICSYGTLEELTSIGKNDKNGNGGQTPHECVTIHLHQILSLFQQAGSCFHQLVKICCRIANGSDIFQTTPWMQSDLSLLII